MKTTTTNYGLAGVRDRAEGGRGELDATEHVRLAKDPMAYNRLLQTGKTINYRQPGGTR